MPDDDLVSEYWRHYRLAIGESREERRSAGDSFWAWDQVERVTKAGGSGAVELLVALADAAPDDAGLAYLGAGPIEDLVRQHGELSVQIEAASRRNPAFATALRAARPS